MRKKTAFQLDQHAYESSIATVSHPRRRVLLDWLHDDSADSATLLDWLRGDGFIILRQENPFMAILQALPTVENPIEPAVKRILLYRLAEAIEWLATDKEARALCAHRTWLELFNLASRLGGNKELSQSIRKLRQSFESDESTPFSDDQGDGLAKAFTRLVMNHQLNDELEERWAGLIRGDRDPILKGSLFDAIRGLLSEPDLISYDMLEECLCDFCNSLDIAYQTDAPSKADKNKREKVEELRNMISADFPHYDQRATLAMASLTRRYHWLPEVDPLLLVIAMTTDHAVLAQLKNRQHTFSDLAAEKYKIMCEITPFSPALKAHVVRRSQERKSGRKLAVGKSNFLSNREPAGDSETIRKNSNSIRRYAEQVKRRTSSGI
jgi:hypothetical protein